MAANPLEEDHERDHRIRERAYHLWEADGRPHGREADYWERARELDGMQSAGETGQLPNPIATGADPRLEDPIEEAFLQDNLGEFPDRFADQGESHPVPKGRAPGHKAKSEPVKAPEPKTKKKAKRATAEPPAAAKKAKGKPK
ncbi:DUF2934 domain-containing protein [Lichenicoccus sp.]|uniref:DUF2934 domain-containing protein n=1 Tax=Lichenicoccus sp. TaxID=2781899 RepID=UPI003D0BCFA3